MSVTRDWSWPSLPHNPQPSRVCCNTLTRSQIQEQDSSEAMQSRDRVMELLIRLEPPLSSQSSEQGVCLCVCLGLSRNSWREPPWKSKRGCECVPALTMWFTKKIITKNCLLLKESDTRENTVIQNSDGNLLFCLKTNTRSQTNHWEDTSFWRLSMSKRDFTKTQTALHTTGYWRV